MAGTTAAEADTGITVVEAHNDWTNNSKLVLTLDAPTAVKDLKVSLRSVDTQETVATLTDFDLVSGTAENGTWTNHRRVQLPDLGSYRIDVSAADEGGDVLDARSVGYFSYAVQTNLKDVRVDRTRVDYDHRSVTIHGHLMGQWPGSGAVTPMGGFPVGVTSYMEYTDVTTAEDGSFSATLPVTSDYQNSIQAMFSYDPNHIFYNQSSSKSFPITLKKTATKIVVKPSTGKVPFQGVVDSTSATLLWDSPTGWQPLVGKTIGSNAFGDNSQRTTDATGTAFFPATQPLWSNFSIDVGWPSDDVFLADASASREILVVQPAAFESFSATRSDAGSVAVSGDLSFDGNWTPAPIPVDIQFSATGKGNWTTVATASSANWDGWGYGFAETAPGTGAGYWRARFTGAPQYENAVSPVVFVAAP
ncbi:hypothetical protein [Streptomyces sp. NPDC021020]|uniref:hypothetical protein n=1 Tax=Streptomyces sp. NPDC021020 TaxID=3365109 RepID=UPI0037A6BB83